MNKYYSMLISKCDCGDDCNCDENCTCGCNGKEK